MSDPEQGKQSDGTEGFVTTNSDAPAKEVEAQKAAEPASDPEGTATPEGEKSEQDNETPTETTGKDTTAETAPTEKKGKSKTQKRIDKLTRQKSETARENEKLQRKIDELEAKKPTPLKAEAEPKEEDFDDYEKYLDAKEKFDEVKDEKPAPKTPEKAPENPVNDDLSDSQKTALEIVQERAQNPENVPDDFEDVVMKKSDLPLSGPMLEALAECENTNDVLYKLGSDIKLAKEIAGKTPAQAAREIAKLDMAPAAEKPKKPVEISKAPKPINPLDGSDAQTKSLSEMNFKELEAHRNEQERLKESTW